MRRPLGQPLHAVPIAADQRLLLGPAPAFNAPLGIDRVRDALELFLIHQPDRPAGARVAAQSASLMFKAFVQALAAFGADVVAAIRAQEDVDDALTALSEISALSTSSLRRRHRRPRRMLQKALGGCAACFEARSSRTSA